VETEPIDILVVEDDELETLNVERALLCNPGVRSVGVARDGVTALRLLRSGRVPRRRLIVLVDLRMPGMDGLEFLRRLRADPELALLPAIVLTTSAEARDCLDAYALNVAGYLLKPPTMERLRERMEAICRYWTQAVFPSGNG
jgi:CheY-like chemotaxis protein